MKNWKIYLTDGRVVNYLGKASLFDRYIIYNIHTHINLEQQ
jgi:hypothetical protein